MNAFMSLLHMLKRSLGLYPPHPLWNELPIFQLASVTENVAAGKGHDHLPTSPDCPSGNRSEMDWDLGGWSRSMAWPACKHVPCHITGILALSC